MINRTNFAMEEAEEPQRSPWSFVGHLYEDQQKFFVALAHDIGSDKEIFEKISSSFRTKFLRRTLMDMMRLTSLQALSVIEECGGRREWLTTIEEMLGAKFASPFELPVRATAEGEMKDNPVNRMSKFVNEEDTTLGRELHRKGMLDTIVLPKDLLNVVMTPDPKTQYALPSPLACQLHSHSV